MGFDFSVCNMHRWWLPVNIPHGIKIFKFNRGNMFIHKNNVTAANDEHLSLKRLTQHALYTCNIEWSCGTCYTLSFVQSWFSWKWKSNVYLCNDECICEMLNKDKLSARMWALSCQIDKSTWIQQQKYASRTQNAFIQRELCQQYSWLVHAFKFSFKLNVNKFGKT